MAKSLEEDLADYLLSLAPGPWMRGYYRECMAQWRQSYGEKTAQKVASIVKDRMKK